MPTVVIPPLMRKFTGGEENITLPGATVREVIDNLESRYPGIKERLCEEDRLKPGHCHIHQWSPHSGILPPTR